MKIGNGRRGEQAYGRRLHQNFQTTSRKTANGENFEEDENPRPSLKRQLRHHPAILQKKRQVLKRAGKKKGKATLKSTLL